MTHGLLNEVFKKNYAGKNLKRSPQNDESYKRTYEYTKFLLSFQHNLNPQEERVQNGHVKPKRNLHSVFTITLLRIYDEMYN